MKKSFIPAMALLGAVAMGGCSFGSTETISSSGITHVGGGKVVVSLNKYGGLNKGNATPIMYDCTKGNICVELGK